MLKKKQSKNCMLPIIFALLTISKPPSVDIDSSLVLLFKELVNAEHTLTASKYFHYTNSDINAHVTPRQKVSFQAFDFSSVSPPSDRENGSDIETNTSIQSIKKILDCVKTICIDSLINNESIIFTLKFIVSFFQLLSNWSLSQMPYLFEVSMMTIANFMKIASHCFLPIISALNLLKKVQSVVWVNSTKMNFMSSLTMFLALKIKLKCPFLFQAFVKD